MIELEVSTGGFAHLEKRRLCPDFQEAEFLPPKQVSFQMEKFSALLQKEMGQLQFLLPGDSGFSRTISQVTLGTVSSSKTGISASCKQHVPWHCLAQLHHSLRELCGHWLKGQLSWR